LQDKANSFVWMLKKYSCFPITFTHHYCKEFVDTIIEDTFQWWTSIYFGHFLSVDFIICSHIILVFILNTLYLICLMVKYFFNYRPIQILYNSGGWPSSVLGFPFPSSVASEFWSGLDFLGQVNFNYWIEEFISHDFKTFNFA
jgi:hypothetical protein